MKKTKQIVASVLIMMLGLIQLPVAQAAMITTDQAIQAQQGDAERTRLISLLQKDELQQQLTAYGLDASMAAERVRSMSDAEVAMLNAKLDELPAGEGIVGLAALFFIVFIITDALGATDIFTFVKPIR
ncbi:MAG: PA2779 family protein [Oceanospirillaceae bacterium]|nr:PA2779 family protein [Oceanospirillaceae bacterium]